MRNKIKLMCSLASAFALAGCTGPSALTNADTVRVINTLKVQPKAITTPEIVATNFHSSALSVLVRRALSRHPDIARAKAVIAKADAGVGAANAAWYPDVTYGVNPGFQNKAYGNASIGLNQLVYDFGKSQAALGAAESEHDKAEQHLKVAVESVAFETSLAYVALATAFEQRREAERYVAELKSLRHKVGSRVEAGASDLSDQITADAAVGRAEGEVERAHANVLTAQSNLAELTGQSPQDVLSLQEIAGMIFKPFGAENINDTPSIRAALSGVASAEYNVARTRAEKLPPIRLAGQYTANMSDKGYQGQSWIGLKVENSFSTGGLGSWKVDAAEADRAAAQQILAGERLKAVTAQKQAAIEVAAASERAKRFAAIHLLAQHSGDLAWEHYQLDKQPLREVISSERETFAAMSDVVAARSDAVKAMLRGLMAVGQLTKALIGPK